MLSGLYLKLGAIAIVIAIAIGGWTYVSHLQTKNKELTIQVSELGDKLKEQNAAVDKFKSEADDRLKNAQPELAAADTKATTIKEQAKIIYKTLPSVGTADCTAERKSTLDLLNGVAK